MPNTGKPSKDCHLCRSRRVKCDLGRPACQRCIKYGAECPGYRDPNELIFRDANPTIKKRRGKRAQQPSRNEVSLTPPSESSSSASGWSAKVTTSTFRVSPATTDDDVDSSMITRGMTHKTAEEWTPYADFDLPISRTINEHWTSHSVPILLNVYSTMRFLNDMYRTCPADGPLVWAAHLFSRTYVINLRYPTAVHAESLAETQNELGTYMGKTLSAVNSALQTPEGALRDDVLATVWILANYELLVGSLGKAHMSSPWHLHARGMYSLLQKRGTKSLASSVGRTAFWSAYNFVQIECIVSSTRCPPESDDWFAAIRANMREDEGPPLAAAVYMNRISGIQSDMLKALRQADYETASSKYESWTAEIISAEKDAETEFLVEESRLDNYWRNIYCAAVVKCYHITHLLTNFLSHYPQCPIPAEQLRQQREHCLQRVRSAAAEIVLYSSRMMVPLIKRTDQSPKALFDALKLIWPLTCVYIMPTTLPAQKAHAEASLFFIGRELGVKQALNSYPGDSAGRVPVEAQIPRGLGEPENVQWVGRLR